jgi:hypothetical protein
MNCPLMRHRTDRAGTCQPGPTSLRRGNHEPSICIATLKKLTILNNRDRVLRGRPKKAEYADGLISRCIDISVSIATSATEFGVESPDHYATQFPGIDLSNRCTCWSRQWRPSNVSNSGLSDLRLLRGHFHAKPPKKLSHDEASIKPSLSAAIESHKHCPCPWIGPDTFRYLIGHFFWRSGLLQFICAS